MAQEGSEASVASSSATPNWWEIHANPISSWNAITGCDDQDVSTSTTSFNNQSTNSCISMDSSSANLPGDLAQNHLWSQVLFSGRRAGDMHNNHDGGDSFLEGLSSKIPATEMFDPACDYLKKLDNRWEFTNHSQVLDGFEKQLNTYNSSMIEPERMTDRPDLVTNWSIAPPNPSMAQYSMLNLSDQMKHDILNSQSFPLNAIDDRSLGYLLSCVNKMKGESHHHGHLGSRSVPALLRPTHNNFTEYQVDDLDDSVIGQNKYCSTGTTDAPRSSNYARNLSHLISFGSNLSKPAMELRASKPSLRVSESSESKKQAYDTTSSTKGNGRGTGTSEGKKQRSEDHNTTEALFKKSKHESSNASSLKAPKVKLTDRITALQQIVSPFGKTDTASVLLEAINYIKFLQEQVQLLGDPYLKSSPNKDDNSLGGMEWKEKTADQKLDLKSRGLCLVPISSTPQLYRENIGPDYWTPTYRGCLYR